jgi:hypothetical protein
MRAPMTARFRRQYGASRSARRTLLKKQAVHDAARGATTGLERQRHD